MKTKQHIVLFISFSMLFIGCSVSSSDKRKQHYKEAYIHEVKLVYFKNCLKNSFDNDAIKKLNRIDKSTMTDAPLGIQLYEKLDSLAEYTAKKIIQDSIQVKGRVAEGAEGKHVYTTCLNEYKSHWLDSLARVEYKKNKK